MNLEQAAHGRAAYEWAECLTDPECTPEPDESCDDGRDGVCTVSLTGIPRWEECGPGEQDGDTPLVLAFSEAPVQFRVMPTSCGFDISAQQRHFRHDWPTAATPWLAADRNRNGRIDSGAELFGSGTLLASGARAGNGFAALAEYDSDGDGLVSENDERFADLVVWADINANKRTDAGELQPLSAYGVDALSLTYTLQRECDTRGNCAVQQASFGFVVDATTRSGRLVDVHLARR